VFVGHFALGFAAKRVTPRVSLAVLFAAAQPADLIWPVLVAAGVEQVRIDPGDTAFTPLDFISYLYSHSLLFLTVWGAVFAAVYRLMAGRNGRAAAVIAGLVVSHWVLDVVTHRPDMPLYPGGRKVGLGLWNSVAATVTVELALYAAGVWIYARATDARDAVGRWSFVALAFVLLVLYIANVIGPTPPSVTAISTGALIGGALLTLWSWWTDRHREAAGTTD
jgi:hypothetical protein